MRKKVRTIVVSLFLAIVGIACFFTFAEKTSAEDEWEPGDPYPPVAGKDWDISAEGILTVNSDAGWQDYLENAPGDWIWEYEDRDIMDERVQTLRIGKNVTKLYIYDDQRLNHDSMYEVDEQLVWGSGPYRPYVSVRLQDPKCMPVKIEVEPGNQVFSMVDGMLINNVKHSVVLSERDISSAVIPQGIREIEAWAFYFRDITSVSFPQTLETIGAAAFSGCLGLKSVTLPDTVTKLGTCAFEGCRNLSNITLSNGLKTMEGYSLSSSGLEEITIPNGIQTIEFGLFSGCDNLKKVNLPNSVKTIGNYAFEYCEALEEIRFPDRLSYIGFQTFYRCKSLERVILPDSLTKIGEEAFLECNMEMLKLPPKLTVLAVPGWERGFTTYPDEVESSKLLGPDSVQTLIVSGTSYSFGEYAVSEADQVVFMQKPPQNINSIVDFIQYGTIYYIDHYRAAWKALEKSVFADCTLKELTTEHVRLMLETGVVPTPEPGATPRPTPSPALSPEEEYQVFEHDGWSISTDEVLTIRSNRGWIDWLRHYDPKLVTTLVIGKDVTEMRIFDMRQPVPIEGFYDIAVEDNTTEEYTLDILNQKSSYLKPFQIFVESGNPAFIYGGGMVVDLRSMEVIMSDARTALQIVIPEGIRSIGQGALRNADMQSIQLPSTLESIGARAFSGCYALKQIDIPNSVVSIGKGAFEYCDALREITLPSGIKTLPEGVFRESGLVSINLPEGITEIGDNSFYSCKKLEFINLPQNLKKIGVDAFSSCEELEWVWFPQGLESIADDAFARCRQLDSIVLPDSLREIGVRAFNACQPSVFRLPPDIDLFYTDESGNKQMFTATDDENLLGLYSVDQLIISGSRYHLGYPEFMNIERVYFQAEPPPNVGAMFDEETTEWMFCSISNQRLWKEATVDGWVRDKIQMMPDGKMTEIVEFELNATPRPMPNELPDGTPTPTPTPQMEQGEAGVDPLLIVFAGVLALVVAGIVVVALKKRKTAANHKGMKRKKERP